MLETAKPGLGSCSPFLEDDRSSIALQVVNKLLR